MNDMANVPELTRIAERADGPLHANPLKIRERPDGGLLWGKFVDQAPPANILIEDFLCCGDLAVLQGEPGSSKTWLMMDMAIAVAHGSRFLGRYPTRRGNVLIIEEEGQAFDLVNRGKILGARKDSDITVYHCRGFHVDSSAWLERVEKDLLPSDEYALILIDPLAAVHTGKENEASDMRAVVDFYRKVRACSPNTAVMFLHHTVKSSYGAAKGSLQHGRGSGALVGAADVVLETIKQGSADPRLIKFELHMPKRRAFAQMGSALSIELDLRQPGEETWRVGESSYGAEHSEPNGEERSSKRSDKDLNQAENIRAKILQAVPTAGFTSATAAFERLGKGTRTKLFFDTWKQLLVEDAIKRVGKIFVIADQAAKHS